MRKADNLPPSCAVVTKPGNLNFLEPSEPVQACNGTALLHLGISCTVFVIICTVRFICFVLCGCFGNMCTYIYCVLYCLYCVFCIVSFMYIYSYLFCLY